MPAMAIGASAAIGGVGSIFSGIMGSSAAKKQASAIKEAAEIARKTALEMDEKARGDVAPFRQFGIDAGNTLSDILSGKKTLDDATMGSSLFKWQQSEGERSLNRQLSARGSFSSGVGLETLARFNAQLVGEEGQRYWDRLFNQETLGSNAAGRMATNTSNTGNNISNMQAQTGMAAAGAEGDAIRSIASIGTGVAGAVQSGVGSYASYKMYEPFLKSLAGGTKSTAMDMNFNPNTAGKSYSLTQ